MALQAAGDARNRKSYTMGRVWQFNRLQLAFSAIWPKAAIRRPGVHISASDPQRTSDVSRNSSLTIIGAGSKEAIRKQVQTTLLTE
jgi:hypothetical protein